MSMLRQYLSAVERSYHYRIKTIVPLDEQAILKIEHEVLYKYVPQQVGKVERTIFQRNPLDFPGIDHAEVYWVDVTLSICASSYILQQEIRNCLGIPEKFIVVRGENEPTEVETQRINAMADMEAEALKAGLVPAALLDNPDYPEGDPTVKGTDLYGAEYNSRFLAHLKKIEDERNQAIAAANAVKGYPFEWLHEKGEPAQDETDFNANIPDAPRAAKVGQDISTIETGVHGELNTNERTYRGLYRDKNGQRKILTKTGVAVKK